MFLLCTGYCRAWLEPRGVSFRCDRELHVRSFFSTLEQIFACSFLCAEAAPQMSISQPGAQLRALPVQAQEEKLCSWQTRTLGEKTNQTTKTQPTETTNQTKTPHTKQQQTQTKQTQQNPGTNTHKGSYIGP